MMTSVARLFCRWARRSYGAAWAKTLPKHTWHGVAGLCIERGVWSLAAAAEIARSLGCSAAAVLIDLRKAYDHMEHGLLTKCWHDRGFNGTLARYLVEQYKAGRLVVSEGAVGADTFPARSVVAGCAFADLAIRAFLFVPMTTAVIRWPAVRGVAVVDDLQFLAVGPPRTVALALSAAFCSLEASLIAMNMVITGENNCSFWRPTAPPRTPSSAGCRP